MSKNKIRKAKEQLIVPPLRTTKYPFKISLPNVKKLSEGRAEIIALDTTNFTFAE